MSRLGISKQSHEDSRAVNESVDARGDAIVEIAQAILDSRISIIAGARQIRRCCGGHAGLDERDPDLKTFVGIDSETDDLPIGDVRQYWAPDALARKDLEIARCEAMYRESALEAASHLVVRFIRDSDT